MASYLNNTSDIILDAVLTDYGRQLLAKGDGSFNIVKFAFGDDEIDYSLYNTGAVSPNQDTDIMSTPILEAFTNNIASMNSKLVTIKQENILFLPVLKMNHVAGNNYKSGSFNSAFNGFVIAVDPSADATSTNNASKFLVSNGGLLLDGVLSTTSQNKVRVDQGLDSTKLNAAESLLTIMPEMYETEYNVFIDSRFGRIKDLGEPLSVDDDYVATYKISTSNADFVKPIPTTNTTQSSIAGTKGTSIEFSIVPTKNLETSDTYFSTYGKSGVQLVAGNNFKTIRTVVEIVGVKTGYSIEIPILFAKV